MAEQASQDAHKNLVRLIESASSELACLSHQARDYLISLAKEGKLEREQTKGSVERWAAELLKRINEGGNQDTTR